MHDFREALVRCLVTNDFTWYAVVCRDPTPFDIRGKRGKVLMKVLMATSSSSLQHKIAYIVLRC